MNVNTEEKVGEIVGADIRTAHVFKKYGIDFCCGGGISLEKACKRKNIELSEVVKDLEKTLAQKDDAALDFDSWSAAELCDYIEETHHSYVKEALPMLKAYAEKVADVHGHHHAELLPMAEKVNAIVDDLVGHLHKEEVILFPWIRQYSETQTRPPFGKFENPIGMMEHEHDVVGELMAEVNALSKNYFLPDYACNTWRAYYHLLKEFEDDLHMHIHLENNVLHKKARLFDVA